MTLSLVAVLALSACGSSSSGGGSDQGSSAPAGMRSCVRFEVASRIGTATVEIKNFAFAPMSRRLRSAQP